MTQETLLALAEELGFDHAGPVRMEALKFLPQVREMCAADRCNSYGRNWTCPPACGTLEEAAARAGRCRMGVLLQTTGFLEDDFDVEAMLAAEARHRARFSAYVERVRQLCPDCLPMGAGACTVCAQCTYPGAPCRFPEKAVPSMEAYGLWVSQVCEDSGLDYCYGPGTLTYTACVLAP